MAEEEVVFPAKKAPAVAAIAIVFGGVALGPFSGGLVVLVVATACWAVLGPRPAPAVFAGKTLRAMSGSKTTEEA
jgi:hypothetical protein